MSYCKLQGLLKLVAATSPAAIILAAITGTKLPYNAVPTAPITVPSRPATVSAPKIQHPVSASALAGLESLHPGSAVKLPLFSPAGVLARVNLTSRDHGVDRIAGVLAGAGGGSFALNRGPGRVDGLVTFPAQKRAYRVQGANLAHAVMQPLPLDAMECSDLPRMRNEPKRAALPLNAAVPMVPILDSRPGAVAQIYLDFDGETVTDPEWNGGQTIVAPAYNISAGDITAVFQRVKDDYWPFNVNITTDVSKYNAAPLGKRMHVIFTPNDVAAPGTGGVAYLHSFAGAGTLYSPDIPCWVFNSSVVGMAEGCSHETGHTFGLTHDGREIPGTGHEEYYEGQPSADGNVATSWGPIMGAGYYVSVTQWSKGEYQYANNQEDDMAIISNATNGIGLVADEAGGTPATSAILNVASTQVNQQGIITSATDTDYYSFYSDGRPVTFSAADLAPAGPDLDIALEIRDGADHVVASKRPVDTLGASLTATLPVGTYYLVVSGDGVPTMPATGYSNYGSAGGYVITGTVPVLAPTLTVGNAAVTEGNSGTTTLNFPVTLSYAVNQTVTLGYTTVDGTATAPADYTAQSGVLSIPPGSLSGQIQVTVNGDTFNELDETLSIKPTSINYAVMYQVNIIGTILDDDFHFPTLAIDNATVVENDTGATNATFTVTLSAPTVQQVMMDYSTANLSATAGLDYSATGGTLTFAPGQLTQTIVVPVLGDTLSEADENFAVNLSNVKHATVTAGQGTGTITDDDPPPSLSVDDVTTAEGNVGTSNATFTVRLSAPSGKTVTVDYLTSDGTAAAGTDYAAQGPATLTFAPGDTTKAIDVAILGDVTKEADETYFVNLSGAVNATIADARGIGTIADDDTATLSVSNPAVLEGNTGTANLVYTVSLSAPTSTTVQVHYATNDAGPFPATAGLDYVAQSGVLNFAPGQTSQTVAVAINGDLTDEENETVGFLLSSALHASISKAQGVGTITDDDRPPVFSINDVSVVEGNAGTTLATFTVRLSVVSGRTVKVQYATTDGAAVAGADYIAQPLATLTFPPGTTSQSLTVPVIGNLLDQPNRTYSVMLSGATNATIGDSSGLGTITDDDTSQISVDDPSVVEGNSGTTNLTYTVKLSVPNSQSVTVQCVTGPTGAFRATAGADYIAWPPTTLTFAPGETAKAVVVAVNGDLLDEENETVSLNLSAATNAVIADAQGVGTIMDDDATPTLTINDVTTPEGNSGTTPATFTVTLSAPSGRTVTVQYATANGTATAGSDYTAQPLTTLTFAPGTTSRTLTVPILGDLATEADETYNVKLSGATNATLLDSQGIGTITNDDSSRLAVDDPSVLEGNSGTAYLVYTVSMPGPSLYPVTVHYALSPSGTFPATPGVDYTDLPAGTLTLAPGQSSKTVTVRVLGDTRNEENETVTLTLSSPTNATLVKATGVGTITNDDSLPLVTVNDVVTVEGNTGTTAANFTVKLSAASGRPVTVSYGTGPTGTYPASAGVDYTPLPLSTLTFAPGETSKTLAVQVAGDVLDEENETYALNLSSPSNATIVKPLGLGTISDDDAAPSFTLSQTGGLYEGDSGTTPFTFVVTLSAPSGRVATVGYEVLDGTAKADTDFLRPTGRLLTFAPGTTTQTFTVLVNGDTLDELDENFYLFFFGRTDGSLVGQVVLPAVIKNDDHSQLSVNDPSVVEGSGGTSYLAYTISLSVPNSRTVKTDWTTGNPAATGPFPATDGADFTGAGGTLTFFPGETTKTVVIRVAGDKLDEEDETVGLSLSSPLVATISKGFGVGTIIDDDGPPALSIGDVAVTEGNSGTTPATFTVKLSAVSGRQITVQYATQNGSATGTQDYVAQSLSTLTFAPGTLSKTVVVPVVGDTVVEPDETFSVKLSGATNATLAKDTGTATIINDDFPQLSVNDPVVVEGNSGTTNLLYTVKLSVAYSSPVTVKYATGSAGAFPATAGTDYIAVPTVTLTFAPGETSKTVAVLVQGDLLDEENETVGLNLSSPTNATIAKGQGVGTIQDDDAAPRMSINDVSTVEGDSGTTLATFTVTLSAVSGRKLTVQYATADGTATAGVDYTAQPLTTLTLAPGTLTQTLVVPIIGDRLHEPNEICQVILSNAANATLADNLALGTIVDNDPVAPPAGGAPSADPTPSAEES